MSIVESRFQNGYVTVEDALKNEYIVPTYQRGYRWEKENVLKLLLDIYENKFVEGEEKTNWLYAIMKKQEQIFYYDDKAVITGAKQPYCIQPLVVCTHMCSEQESCEEETYDVIDGQQRLTTITIILCALKNACNGELEQIPEVRLSYESRKSSKDYLEKMWKDEIDENDSIKNLDFRYMKQAYDIAYTFFKEELGKIEERSRKQYATYLKDVLLINTRFIWYCIDQNVTDPHEVFANFNSGKIELTNAELVKALFMDAANYDNVKNVREIEDKRIVISEKWDEIETSLHNSDFWAFVPHPNQYLDFSKGDANDCINKGGCYDTRIDLIFELFLMIQHITCPNKEFEKLLHLEKDPVEAYLCFRRENKRDRYIFDEMEAWIKGELAEAEKNGNSKNLVMQKCWSDIRKIYLGLQELYQVDTIESNNNKIYNMVGLYINLANRIPGRVDAYSSDEELYFRVYYNLFKVMQAPRDGVGDRKTKLKELIKKEIGLTESLETEIKKIRHSRSDESSTTVDKTADKIVKLLLAYNIGLLNNSDGIGQRFDFLAFANITWEREHIFATNVKEEENEKKGLDVKEERLAALKILSEEFDSNKYIEYVKYVYYGDKEGCFPPEFTYNGNRMVLDLNNDNQVETFIANNLSTPHTTPASMLARALSAYKESKTVKHYYDILGQLEDAENYGRLDAEIQRQLYYRVLVDLEKAFYTRDYVNIRKIIEEKYEGAIATENAEYTIEVGDWIRKEKIDSTKEKKDVVEIIHKAYSEYVRNLYMKNDNGTGLAEDYRVKGYQEINEDEWRKLSHVFNVCERTLDTNINMFFTDSFAKLLADNTMGNMTLLISGEQNQSVGAKSFKLKKQSIHNFFQAGHFVPLGTVLVFSDAYNDSSNTANFWLPDSRLRYLKNMINTLKSFLDN